ncbi:MAG: DUF4124 domain-containing protein, partial [Pseudomonadales bacterium]|nr:DUF4124 domain-containing protein [Pseudomonadales bacterium]
GTIMRLYIIFVLANLGTPVTQAEMYRWVDTEGKVHFSDRKPSNQAAEDITNAVKPINTDYGGAHTKQQLQQYERHRMAKKTEQKQREKYTTDADQERQEQCMAARKSLKVIQGRVIFYDENHQEVKVTETERAQKAEELARQIKTYCG